VAPGSETEQNVASGARSSWSSPGHSGNDRNAGQSGHTKLGDRALLGRRFKQLLVFGNFQSHAIDFFGSAGGRENDYRIEYDVKSVDQMTLNQIHSQIDRAVMNNNVTVCSKTTRSNKKTLKTILFIMLKSTAYAYVFIEHDGFVIGITYTFRTNNVVLRSKSAGRIGPLHVYTTWTHARWLKRCGGKLINTVSRHPTEIVWTQSAKSVRGVLGR